MMTTGIEKAVVATLGAAVTSALGLVPPTSPLWTVLTILAAALTAAGVYFVPNTPAAPAEDYVGTHRPPVVDDLPDPPAAAVQ